MNVNELIEEFENSDDAIRFLKSVLKDVLNEHRNGIESDLRRKIEFVLCFNSSSSSEIAAWMTNIIVGSATFDVKTEFARNPSIRSFFE